MCVKVSPAIDEVGGMEGRHTFCVRTISGFLSLEIEICMDTHTHTHTHTNTPLTHTHTYSPRHPHTDTGRQSCHVVYRLMSCGVNI